jgi:hypothetical protein
MAEIIGLATVVVGLVLLWSGHRRIELGSFASTVLSLLELLGLGLAIWSAGWWGVFALGAVNVVAVLIWSVVLAMRVESKVVYAGIQLGEPKDRMKALADRLGSRKELKVLGATERAELIRLLAERDRTVAEIEDMAVPVAMLNSIHSVSMSWLVEQFDRLMRLTGEPADRAHQVADTIHSTSTHAAATFKDIVEALVAFYSGESPTAEPAPA